MPRTVIVGDVHGCRAELEDLLEVVGLGAADRLLFVGDLVARGPDSKGVLDLATRLGAGSVLGNHEKKLLDARRAQRNGERPKLGSSHRELLETLSDPYWAILESLPLHLDCPEHDLRIVHAGLVPGVPIEEQAPWVLTHIRTLEDDGTPSGERGPPLWASRYHEPPHVVFGHNAVDGLQLFEHATGLDTGCVYGGALTALVLAENQPVPPLADRGDALKSVPARRAYVQFEK